MAKWEFALSVDPASATPLFLQIARAIADAVRNGRLESGDPLPSSRQLAKTLSVHRNTVLSAYDELRAEGWITSEAAIGTFVSRSIPDAPPRAFAPKAAGTEAGLGFDLCPPPERYLRSAYPPGTLVMGSGTPDVRLIPVEDLARAYRRALRFVGAQALTYADPRGHERLRSALAAMLSSVRGVTASEQTLMVTRGSQMALYLIARTIVRSGDVVAVEALGYQPSWEAFRAAGARLEPIPVDRCGLSVDDLARLLAREPVRALYLTPHHQYPTTVTLDPGRRIRLLELARSHRFAIIEDDYDNEFHYEGRPIMPLASADPAGVVLYVGTLSKILAPGLRMGFVVAPEPLIAQMADRRLLIDRQGDQAMEYAIAALLEDGEIRRHARKVGRIYRDRREALAEALLETFGDRVTFTLPAGGMALWARFAGDVDTATWAERALRHGVGFSPQQRFHLHGETGPHARLGFAALTDQELRRAVQAMFASYSDR